MKDLGFLDGRHDVNEEHLLRSLPHEYARNLVPQIETELRTLPDELVVYLEDDSTGVQMSHDVYLITDISEGGIRSGIQAARIAGHRLVFILTNSRALSSQDAEALNRRIAQKLVQIAREAGLVFRIGSRSDSTLRGHFPLEPLVLMEVLNSEMSPCDGIIVSHAFLTEMRRITVNRKHLLRIRKEDGSYWYRPVHLTKFAEDKRFGYPTSDLAEYVEYKFNTSGLGKVKAEDVLHIHINTLRAGGPEEVTKRLVTAEKGRIITWDAITEKDIQVFVLGLLMAEREGKTFIYRSAASLPPARVNMKDKPVLARTDLLEAQQSAGNILCVWGSIVELSNTQLEATLRHRLGLVPVPVDVRKILVNEKDRAAAVTRAITGVETAFMKGKHALVYTVPRREYPPEQLSNEQRAFNQQRIAAALQEVYNSINIRPSTVIFKGGTTSSMGLFHSGATRVYVLGQIASGIPIVKILPEDNTRFPGQSMLMVLGPGNVGTPRTYVEILEKLTCV